MKLLTARFRGLAPTGVSVWFLPVVVLALLPSVFGQDFALQTTPFNPLAVDPGGSSISTITVSPLNGFNSAVTLTCQATSQQTTGTPPVCQVSPTSVTNSTATVTVTSSGTTTPALYTVTMTGTGPTTTHTAQQNLTVLAVTPQFTITVGTTVAPSSVHAGSGGQGVVNVNPINGYSGTVTLSCSAVTPLVTIPPVCSFNPASVVVNGVATTSTISISTTAPTTGSLLVPRSFYAVWLPLPMLALMGIGVSARGKRRRRVWGVFVLFTIAAALLLTPACGNSSSSSSTTTNTNGATPNNSYTFTLMGVDANGVVSSNTGTTTSNPTVSLTVD